MVANPAKSKGNAKLAETRVNHDKVTEELKTIAPSLTEPDEKTFIYLPKKEDDY